MTDQTEAEPSSKLLLKEAAGRSSFKSGAAVLVTLIVVGAVLLAGFAFYSQKIAPNSHVAGLSLGGMRTTEAETALDAWWDTAKAKPVRIIGAEGERFISPVQLGLSLDTERTVSRLPRQGLGAILRKTDQSGSEFDVVLDTTGLDGPLLEKIYLEVRPKPSSARVTLDESGALVRKPEVPAMSLDVQETLQSLARAVTSGGDCELVGSAAEKRIKDPALDEITEVVSEFSTNFKAWDRKRSKNLKVAAAKIDGHVLLPGEKFSFNDVVGERSEANGFDLAGVYRRGRHEIDYGGGVCQVSTTLFNAAMLAGLKLNARANHSFAVPYVPVGRDAAVAYGLQDMVFTNDTDRPMAVSAEWKPGKLTFRMLGKKDAQRRVEITQTITAVWEHPVKYIEDPKLPPGTEKEIEKGGKGFKAVTRRKVFQGDVQVSDDLLMKSHYKGAPKIIARGPALAPVIDEPIGFQGL